MTGAVRKYLHTLRDPRDACLSWVHYHGKSDPKEVDEVLRNRPVSQGRNLILFSRLF